MMRLFGMECKKIAKSALYWVLVLALLAVSLYQYDPSVESELHRTNDPASVLAVTMTLGFVGLLASAVSGNTAVGFLVSFCWYCVLQVENIGTIFKSVSNGISVYQVLLLLGSGVAIVFFSARRLQRR